MRTRLTALLDVEHPVMLAGMGGVSYHRLVAAVSEAGGFGTLGASTMRPEEMIEEMAKTLCDNYLDNVEAYCNKEKLKDAITEEEIEPDEKLMRSIEEQIGVSENGKNTFRQEILIRISSHARKGKPFEYKSHERLKEAIEKKIFSDLKDVVKITTSTKTPDADQLRRINEVIDRLVSQNGYCTVCANELLTYVGTLLSR
jgi:serine protein kinase